MTSPIPDAPPFTITPAVLRLSLEIGERIGRLEGLVAARAEPRLRRKNRIRTVQATVAIEGNSLSLDQITALLEGKPVAGPRRELLEVQNAVAAYEAASGWKPWSEKDLLAAHRVLMSGLTADAGKWRRSAVGIMRGRRVAHVAPPHARVPHLMQRLLRWGARADVPLLIKACVVHYEIQFIHPFSDGNGRLSRLWQHVALMRMSEAFASLPVESVIRDRQSEYYAALRTSDREGSSTPFLEFALAALRDALDDHLSVTRTPRETSAARLMRAYEVFAQEPFSRGDYLRVHKRLSTATASRDLKEGVHKGVLRRQGDRRLARYVFRRRPDPAD